LPTGEVRGMTGLLTEAYGCVLAADVAALR
jgi:hypothetical protein